MSEPAFLSGPHRVDQPHPELAHALADLFGRVTVAGGATGFTPTTDVAKLSEPAERIVEDLGTKPKRRHVLIAGREHSLAGAVVLRPGELPASEHSAEIEWLLVDPELDDQEMVGRLLDAAESHALALGLSRLSVHTRSGTDQFGADIERFYTDRGWTSRGRQPAVLRVGDDDWRDEVWLTRELGS